MVCINGCCGYCFFFDQSRANLSTNSPCATPLLHSTSTHILHTSTSSPPLLAPTTSTILKKKADEHTFLPPKNTRQAPIFYQSPSVRPLHVVPFLFHARWCPLQRQTAGTARSGVSSARRPGGTASASTPTGNIQTNWKSMGNLCESYGKFMGNLQENYGDGSSDL